MAPLQQKKAEVRKFARHPGKSMRTTISHQRPDGVIGEWETIPKETWNRHQIIAARTLGVVTVANVVSIAGAALTADGMRDYHNRNYTKAVLKVGAGRSLDLLDGVIAKRYGTRGVVGAGLDAGLDKALAAAMIFLTTYDGDMSPVEATAHVLQQAEIVATNLAIKRAGGEPNPSKSGKRGQFALWARAGGILLSNATDEHDNQTWTTLITTASEMAGSAAMELNHQANQDYQEYFESLAIAA